MARGVHPRSKTEADGTVDLVALRQDLAQAPTYASKGVEALGACLPSLEAATSTEESSSEDEIELQDSVLRFARCLGDEGFQVPDPDLSGGDARANAIPIVADLKDPASGE